MIRSLGVSDALTAVLALGSVSQATLFTYDVSGPGPADPSGGGGTVNSVSSFCPGSPGCSASPGSDWFVGPFSPGSTVSLDITGNAVTLTGATLNINLTTVLGVIGSIITNVTATMTGGTGTLNGANILWSTPTTVASTGTFQCTGGICTLAGLTAGMDYPIALLSSIAGTTPVSSVDLGQWFLKSDLSRVTGSTRAVVALGGSSGPPGLGQPAQWYTFGPEPSEIALVLAGLGVLGLRLRRARPASDPPVAS